jgi:hypothetical protein
MTETLKGALCSREEPKGKMNELCDMTEICRELRENQLLSQARRKRNKEKTNHLRPINAKCTFTDRIRWYI